MIRISFLYSLVAISAVSAAFLVPGTPVSAETLVEEQVTIVRAVAVKASEPVTEVLDGLGGESSRQSITAQILDGENQGREVVFDNDYVMLETGEVFYIKHVHDTTTGADFYFVADPYRLPVLLFLFILFLIICIGVGRWQGLRGVLSLCASIASIYYILIPAILAGFNPVISSLGVASLIVVCGSYITHGFSRTTTSAVIGMVLTIAGTGLLAHWALVYARLTGYAADESVYLVLNSNGELSLVALLLGGILIGLLGVLYYSAIGQAIAVEELYRSGQSSGSAHTVSYVFSRAMRIGREHIGALVNTLAIAYVGASLPLLLLVSQASTAPLLVTLNSEVFATEIIRIIIGSIGIIGTVPVTTLIAVYLLRGQTFAGEHVGHHHH